MKILRSVHTRVRIAALALFALVVQLSAVGLHQGAMASSQAERASISVELAALGLTLADLPCHAGLQGMGVIPDGGSTSDPDSASVVCPICKLHAQAVALPPPAAVALITPQAAVESATPTKRLAVSSRHILRQARAPPQMA